MVTSGLFLRSKNYSEAGQSERVSLGLGELEQKHILPWTNIPALTETGKSSSETSAVAWLSIL